MQHSVLFSILEYLHGDGLVILPEMELLLFALGILIFDFLLEKKEKHWNAILALLGVAASAFDLFLQSRRYNALRLDPAFSRDLVGFHDTVVVDGFFLVFASIVLGAAYLLWLYQRVMFGPVTHEVNNTLPDLNFREYAVLLPLVAMAFWIGIYPKPFFNYINNPVEKIVHQVNPDFYKSAANRSAQLPKALPPARAVPAPPAPGTLEVK